MQLVERLFYFGIDPCFPAISGLLGADRDDIGEGCVSGHPETVGSDGLAQRTRHPQTLERDNRTGLWFNPEGFRIIPGIGHRKDPRRIGFYQKIEINSHE